MSSAPGGIPGLHGQPETVFVYVPSASVGAIIGRKGSHIRSMIRFSGASVKIGQQEEVPLGGNQPGGAGPGAEAAAEGGDGEEQPQQPQEGAGDGGDAAGAAESEDVVVEAGEQAAAAAAAGQEGDELQDVQEQQPDSTVVDSLLELKQKVEGLQLRAPAAQLERPPERKVAIFGTPEAQWKVGGATEAHREIRANTWKAAGCRTVVPN